MNKKSWSYEEIRDLVIQAPQDKYYDVICGECMKPFTIYIHGKEAHMLMTCYNCESSTILLLHSKAN